MIFHLDMCPIEVYCMISKQTIHICEENMIGNDGFRNFEKGKTEIIKKRQLGEVGERWENRERQRREVASWGTLEEEGLKKF